MNTFRTTCKKLKNIFDKAWYRIKLLHEKLSPHPVRHIALISLVLVFIIEVLSRHSFFDALKFMFFTPHIFIYNCIIIALTLTPAFLFKKKDFMLFLFSMIWLGLGIANCCVLSFRITPLGAVDIALLDSVMDIFDRYLEKWHIILICIGTLALLALIVYLWIKAPKRTVRYIHSAVSLVLMAIVTMSATQLSLSASAIEDELGNLADAYDDYGFAYCFSASVVDRGIDRPDDYSAERIGEIISALPPAKSLDSYPNIIFVQLESFFDVQTVEYLRCSEDPIPYFRSLMENYSSGAFKVPSVGAGTANTEFETISGMNMRYFGPGEYPHKTIMKKTTCDSIPYALRDIGYNTHAIHNNKATFYSRVDVFPNLGFETYTSK